MVNITLPMPELFVPSLTVPAIVSDPLLEYAMPAVTVGTSTVTVGGTVSTVRREVLVVELPARSVATTTTLCVPSATLRLQLHFPALARVAATGAPPSTEIVTLAIPDAPSPLSAAVPVKLTDLVFDEETPPG